MPEGGNPDIVKHAEGHRFGDAGGADPSAAGKKGNESRWSIRSSLKRIGRFEFDVSEEGMQNLSEQFRRAFNSKKLTGSELAAIKKFSQAMLNEQAMDKLIEHIDGKLVERKVEATVTLADLVNGSYDEPDQTSSE